MKTRDYLIVALAPLPVLLIPLIGMMISQEWKWTWSDFVVGWTLLAGATAAYRLLATRTWASFAYRAGAALAVVAAFLLTWVTMAVQIIGDENPANMFYAGVIAIGLIGMAVARFRAAGLAHTAWAMALAVMIVPVIAVCAWPTDFSPGVGKVFLLNGGFALMFAGAGWLFRRAARNALPFSV